MTNKSWVKGGSVGTRMYEETRIGRSQVCHLQGQLSPRADDITQKVCPYLIKIIFLDWINPGVESRYT